MPRPSVVVFANETLFQSFFQGDRSRRLKKLFAMERIDSRKIAPSAKKKLADAEAIITTWDSRNFGPDLNRLAPRLKVIAHCGGEVKKRFDASLFRQLTITNAAGPFARPVAEFAAALLLYTARNIDAYRAAMQKSPNQIHKTLHATGVLANTMGQAATLVGREIP